MFETMVDSKTGWRVGKIKFYSIDKNFGYLFDGMGYWNDKERYFNSSAVKNTLRSDDYICFKSSKNEENKLVITEITLIDKDFVDQYFPQLDYYFKLKIVSLLPKTLKNEITSVVENFNEKIDELKKDECFSPEYLDINEFINDFVLTLEINYRAKPGDDDSLWIGYILKNKKLDYCFIPDLPNFKNPIISVSGYASFYHLKDSFEENEKDDCENNIPQLLDSIKEIIISDYHIRKKKSFEYELKPMFEEQIKKSICEIGWNETFDKIDNVFVSFTKIAKQNDAFAFRHSLCKKV